MRPHSAGMPNSNKVLAAHPTTVYTNLPRNSWKLTFLQSVFLFFSFSLTVSLSVYLSVRLSLIRPDLCTLRQQVKCDELTLKMKLIATIDDGFFAHQYGDRVRNKRRWKAFYCRHRINEVVCRHKRSEWRIKQAIKGVSLIANEDVEGDS